ncbi:hypothetical protein AQUCO_00300672v1 [Aquilegia coerulea]|uniref:Pectinesterase inhibitor domain-containing protein n=1 Tax=Aquilegia coerulea TaxID=218851 RepID=A0A2G5EZW5_AQUCA|nr:hypothetical protein AQUCO_00300672v1 [Aquilegia coerulea]
MNSKLIISRFLDFQLLLITILFTFQFHQFLAANTVVVPPKATDLITQTCEKSTYKDLCVQVLNSDPTSKQADLMGLAKIIMNHAADIASNITGHIDKLLSGNAADRSIQDCLTDCDEFYTDASDQLEDSIAALDTKDYSDIKKWLEAAIADVDSCEGAFKDQNASRKSVLASENDNFSQFCHIALDMTSLLAKT